jgi:hypothetical protein
LQEIELLRYCSYIHFSSAMATNTAAATAAADGAAMLRSL